MSAIFNSPSDLKLFSAPFTGMGIEMPGFAYSRILIVMVIIYSLVPAHLADCVEIEPEPCQEPAPEQSHAYRSRPDYLTQPPRRPTSASRVTSSARVASLTTPLVVGLIAKLGRRVPTWCRTRSDRGTRLTLPRPIHLLFRCDRALIWRFLPGYVTFNDQLDHRC